METRRATLARGGDMSEAMRYVTVPTREESVMPETYKPKSKAAAAALKAIENMAIETADLNVHIEQLREKLKPAGISAEIGSIFYAGRSSSGSPWVTVIVRGSTFGSTWPEWAFGVAEGALHSNKKVFVIYDNEPFGPNLQQVLCTNTPV
jgi:hypothetical protein